EPPARPFNDVAMGDGDVWPERAIGAGFRIMLLALIAGSRGAMRAFGVNCRASRLLDTPRVRRMIAMGMGDDDMRHGLATHGIEQRLGVRLVIRAGIEDRDLVPADDVADGAGEGKRARIVTEHAPHARPYFLDDAGF